MWPRETGLSVFLAFPLVLQQFFGQVWRAFGVGVKGVAGRDAIVEQ